MMSPEELFDIALKADIITKGKAPWFVFGATKLGPGKTGAVKKLIAEPKLYRKIEKALPVVEQPAQPVISVGKSFDSPVPAGDISKIGIRTVETQVVKPVMNAADQMQSPGQMYQNRMIQRQVAQPNLTEDEAISLGGLYGWHQFRRADHLFTTVIQGRRFLIEKAVFYRMKDRGLAIEVDPYRN